MGDWVFNRRFSMINGFVPTVNSGQTFTVLTAASLSGAFANVPNGTRLLATDGFSSFQVNYGSASAFPSLTHSVVLSDFAVVPEPSTWALLGLGASLVLLRGRRRR